MSEIKSTLELAMERSQKVTISEKEREEIKRKRLEKKVNGLLNRYIEGRLPVNEILREMERMDEKTQAEVREILLSQWIEALSLSDEDDRLLKGIESLKHRSLDELKQTHYKLISQYQKEKDRLKEEARTQWIETLRKNGIYGSAVEPNIEVNPFWKKEEGTLEQRYGKKLKELKEQLKAL